jgi:regulator of sigma D
MGSGRLAGIGTDSIITWRRQRLRLQQNLQQTSVHCLERLSDRELDLQLGHLCRDLMDYLSTSHSSVFTRCSPRKGHGGSERQRAVKDILLHLGRTTDAALRFNERCETTPAGALQQRLHGELGRLNKTLALRFALEEQLLELGAGGTASAAD